MFEAKHKAEITPPVRARFFRFRTGGYTYTDERGFQPCIKAELYTKTGELGSQLHSGYSRPKPDFCHKQGQKGEVLKVSRQKSQNHAQIQDGRQ